VLPRTMTHNGSFTGLSMLCSLLWNIFLISSFHGFHFISLPRYKYDVPFSIWLSNCSWLATEFSFTCRKFFDIHATICQIPKRFYKLWCHNISRPSKGALIHVDFLTIISNLTCHCNQRSLKLYNKWHTSHINLTYCIKCNMYQHCIIHIILKCAFFRQSVLDSKKYR
jgi:hypothetical protein